MDPLELIVIAGIVIVFLVLGPKKIPEFMRSLGSAKKEFAKSAAGSEGDVAAASSATRSDDQLVQTAKQLGIATEGKTASQISDEIVRRTRAAGLQN